MRTKMTKWIVIGLGALFTAGCQNGTDPDPNFIPPENQVRDTQRIMDTQAARGARTDAMLHECHFDGAELNSLGAAKLDLMLRDNETKLPLVVYMDFEGDQKARRASVEKYLGEIGLRTAQVQLVAGFNPKSSGSAEAGIKSMKSTKQVGTPEVEMGPGETPSGPPPIK